MSGWRAAATLALLSAVWFASGCAHTDASQASSEAPPSAERSSPAIAPAVATIAPASSGIRISVKERLRGAQMSVWWQQATPVQTLGEIARAADVPIYLAASATADRIGQDTTIASLRLNAVSAELALRVACRLVGLAWTILDERIIVHAKGDSPTTETTLVEVPPVAPTRIESPGDSPSDTPL